MPRPALLPPRPSLAGSTPEDQFEINAHKVATTRHSDDSDDNDDKTTTVPRASRPAKPGLPMPLTIAEYDYVIVDNDAAKPESSPSGACATPQRASEWSSSADCVE